MKVMIHMDIIIIDFVTSLLRVLNMLSVSMVSYIKLLQPLFCLDGSQRHRLVSFTFCNRHLICKASPPKMERDVLEPLDRLAEFV